MNMKYYIGDELSLRGKEKSLIRKYDIDKLKKRLVKEKSSLTVLKDMRERYAGEYINITQTKQLDTTINLIEEIVISCNREIDYYLRKLKYQDAEILRSQKKILLQFANYSKGDLLKIYYFLGSDKYKNGKIDKNKLAAEIAIGLYLRTLDYSICHEIIEASKEHYSSRTKKQELVIEKMIIDDIRNSDTENDEYEFIDG